MGADKLINHVETHGFDEDAAKMAAEAEVKTGAGTPVDEHGGEPELPDGDDQGGRDNAPKGGSTEGSESTGDGADTDGDFSSFGIIIGIVVFLIVLLAWFCLRQRQRPPPQRRPNNTGNSAPGTPSSRTRRRLIKTPFSKLADELVIQHTAQPLQIETITQNESCETYQEIVRECISDKDNLVWIVPVAVLEKLFCAYVLYKLYRTCRRKRIHTLKSRQTMLAP